MSILNVDTDRLTQEAKYRQSLFAEARKQLEDEGDFTEEQIELTMDYLADTPTALLDAIVNKPENVVYREMNQLFTPENLVKLADLGEVSGLTMEQAVASVSASMATKQEVHIGPERNEHT